MFIFILFISSYLTPTFINYFDYPIIIWFSYCKNIYNSNYPLLKLYILICMIFAVIHGVLFEFFFPPDFCLVDMGYFFPSLVRPSAMCHWPSLKVGGLSLFVRKAFIFFALKYKYIYIIYNIFGVIFISIFKINVLFFVKSFRVIR